MTSSSRRDVLLTAGALGVAGAICGGIYSRFVHPFRPRLNEIDILLPSAHAHFAGLRIAFVTDTHVGPNFTNVDLEPTIEMLEAIQADVVLYGGDFISESPRFLEYVQEPLIRMAATSRFGNWAVLGNHDLANIRARCLTMLEPTGIVVLDNESVPIHTDRGTFWLTGIDDALLGNAQVARSFANVPDGALNIAMWHEPDKAEEVLPFAPLVLLSGHTHGGQVRLPFIGPVATPKLGKRYVSGRFDLGPTTLYVSNGIGMYRPPVRFNCPPEVMLFTFTI